MVKNMKSLNQIIQESAKADKWQAEERFTVFAQPDKAFYLPQKLFYIHKYQVLRALVKHLKPKSIVELGVCAGSGANAMLSALDFKCEYYGYDQWEHLPPNEIDGDLVYWDRFAIVNEIFKENNFETYTLTRTNTRDIEDLPQVDFVLVDCAHDYRNQYRDCVLALKANPKWIYVDDIIVPEAALAVKDFQKDFKHLIHSVDKIEQINGGCLITMKQSDVSSES